MKRNTKKVFNALKPPKYKVIFGKRFGRKVITEVIFNTYQEADEFGNDWYKVDNIPYRVIEHHENKRKSSKKS